MPQKTYKKLISQIYENDESHMFENLSEEQLRDCLTLIMEITNQRQSQQSKEPGMHKEILKLWESLWGRTSEADDIYKITRKETLDLSSLVNALTVALPSPLVVTEIQKGSTPSASKASKSASK